jgi:outer membrane assembly lipoprotein YfiO
MPTSPFVNTARYKRAESYYQLSPKAQLDQKYTRYALDNFQTFVEFSPADSLVADATAKIQELTLKLAQKMFEGGKLYYRLEYYRASISYFDKLIQDYHDSPFVDDGMLWKAKSMNERKDFDGAAQQVLNELNAKFPDNGPVRRDRIAACEDRRRQDRVSGRSIAKRQLSISNE